MLPAGWGWLPWAESPSADRSVALGCVAGVTSGCGLTATVESQNLLAFALAVYLGSPKSLTVVAFIQASLVWQGVTWPSIRNDV